MIKKICNILLGILIAGMLLIAGALLIPYAFGVRPMTVLTGSMEPKFPVGSIVYVNTKVKPETLKPNDIITFRLDGGMVATHRVVSVDTAKKEFVTKGDANNVADGSRSFSTFIGRSSNFAIPVIGYVAQSMHTTKGIVIGIGVLLVMMLLIFLPDCFKKQQPQQDSEGPSAEIKQTKTSTEKERIPASNEISSAKTQTKN